MRIELEGGTKLSFFQDLYKDARAYAEELLAQMDKNYKQYKGSKEIDGSSVEAKTIRNITYELVESQITGYIPNPKVSPKMYSEKNERLAKSTETLLSNKRNDLNFEKMNDMDERYSPIYGGSVWLTEWDESIVTHNTVGDVNVTCLAPSKFTGQPHLFEVQDMEYCFVQFDTTKEDIERRYGVSPKIADEAESEENADDKTATLYVCYYRDDEGKICQYVWSGDTELLDVEDYFSRKRKVCKKCGRKEQICNCEKPKFELLSEEWEELTRDIPLTYGGVIPAQSPVIKDGQPVMETEMHDSITAQGGMAMEEVAGSLLAIPTAVQVPKMEPTKLPYYRPTMLPIVIRKNTSQEDSLFGQSDCEFIRPQQQAINKIESRILEKILKSGVIPVVPEGCNFNLDNSLYDKVIRLKPGESSYGVVDLSVDISKDIAAAERQYDQAKRILGITDSFQGQYDSSAQSGKAKQLQIQQAAGRLDSKRQMKNAAYAEIDKIIFQYYLAFADEPRPAAYRDAMGHLQNVIFNRYDFIERDEAGVYYYNDEFLFSCDATVDVDKQRDFIWQENRQNFQTGAYGDPALPQTQLIFWLNMEKAHYPGAQDNVERIRSELMQQMQQMQAQIQQQSGQIQQLQTEVQNRAGYEQHLIKQFEEKLKGITAK